MTKGNETAYPSPAFSEGGLTKREHIAIAAMQGLMATTGDGYSSSNIASCAVRMADALIKELNQTK
jgi:hypothetical protein